MSEKQKQLIKPFFGDLKDTPLFYYIVINELPEDQRIPFSEWLVGQTMPVVYPDVRLDCAYSWDYELWFDYWSKGKLAPITD